MPAGLGLDCQISTHSWGTRRHLIYVSCQAGKIANIYHACVSAMDDLRHGILRAASANGTMLRLSAQLDVVCLDGTHVELTY